jgi:two-component system, cell cycle response regulator DivK
MAELGMAKILLVEDDETNMDMLSKRLQSRGHHVIPALDGKQALSLAQSQNPDLILMDISLPVMDGWELTRLLKAGKATRHIPIIALTGHALVTDREKALNVGCDEYETKPVDFRRLSRKIDDLLLATKSPAAAEPLAVAKRAR